MTLHFEEHGSGPALTILHGFLGSGQNWRTLSRRFGDRFSVYAVDQRNHGQSPHDPEINYDLMAADLYNHLESQGIRQTHLIGHSMGGKTALKFAVEYPDLVERLIIVDILPKEYSASGHRSILDALLALRLDDISSRKDALEALADGIPDQSVRNFLLKNLVKGEQGYEWLIPVETLNDQYENIRAGFSWDHPIEPPTLLVYGENSGYIKPGDLEEWSDRFESLNVSALEAGHWVHAERPDQFFQVVSDFLG